MSKIGLLALLLALIALGGGVFGYQLIRHQQQEIAQLRSEVAEFSPRFDKFKIAVRDMGRELTSLVMDEIELTKPGWQSIGKGFYVIDAAATPDAKGITLRGKVINTTGVAHEGLVFRARVGSDAATFKLEKAAPGVALPFEVVIPVAAPQQPGAGKGFLTLESSTISFASSTGKASAPREPVDPDKLLR
ncbi:MAG TPA: hypothetical protein VFH73_11445 [Polyangia bacterium]|jgi:hypothetical protein|nr:hypothetical protein [Polyangia bacterium]